MRSRPSLLRIGGVGFAVVLAGSYVWFRVAQAQQHDDRLPPGSKVARVRVSTDPFAATQPTTTFTIGSLQYKLDPELSRDVVFHSSKSGRIVIVPAQPNQPTTTTAPTTKLPDTLIWSSKSAPINLIPRDQPATNPTQR